MFRIIIAIFAVLAIAPAAHADVESCAEALYCATADERADHMADCLDDIADDEIDRLAHRLTAIGRALRQLEQDAPDLCEDGYDAYGWKAESGE